MKGGATFWHKKLLIELIDSLCGSFFFLWV
jgi:hypothetical protein